MTSTRSRLFAMGCLALATAVLAGSCSVTPTATSRPTRSSSPSSTSAAPVATGTPARIGAPIWLCEPGAVKDPCEYPRSVTAVEENGSETPAAKGARRAMADMFDCFYVYPTVSTQSTPNANLTVQPAEVDVAVDQASQFSQVCNVWAPMYRQATDASVAGAATGRPGAALVLETAIGVAYRSLLGAFDYFIAHDAGDRPIILIGHSQGAAILIRLISTYIDHDPALLHRLVVAILPGGNLQVPTGKTVGATFTKVPLCTNSSETGCAIAYSTFPSEPPADSLFGRAGQGVSLLSGEEASTASGQQVACVNPGDLSGGSRPLVPYFVTVTQAGLNPAPSTPWVTYPGLYTASCRTKGGATWLQVSTHAGSNSGSSRPVVGETLGPAWGYHLFDVNLVLGNLLTDVASEETAWLHRHR